MRFRSSHLCAGIAYGAMFSGVSLRDSWSRESSQKEAQQSWISGLGAPSETGNSSQNTSCLPASWSLGESYFPLGEAEITGEQETTHLELCFISDQASHDHEQLLLAPGIQPLAENSD